MGNLDPVKVPVPLSFLCVLTHILIHPRSHKYTTAIFILFFHAENSLLSVTSVGVSYNPQYAQSTLSLRFVWRLRDLSHPPILFHIVNPRNEVPV